MGGFPLFAHYSSVLRGASVQAAGSPSPEAGPPYTVGRGSGMCSGSSPRSTRRFLTLARPALYAPESSAGGQEAGGGFVARLALAEGSSKRLMSGASTIFFGVAGPDPLLGEGPSTGAGGATSEDAAV